MPRGDNYTSSIRNVFILTLLLVLIFQDGITTVISKWSYFDEIFTLAALTMNLAVRIYRRDWKISRFDLSAGLCVFVYFFSTWFGTILHQYQSNEVSLAASFLGIKWFIGFWSCKYLGKVYAKNDNICLADKRVLYEVVVAFGIVENCYWIPNIQNVFNQEAYHNILSPMSLCAASVALIGLVLSEWENKRRDYICLGLLLENLLFSTKAKGYGAFLITLFLVYWIIIKKRFVKLRHLGLLAVACVVLAWDKIHFYYIYAAAPEHDYARYRLVATGLQIMRDFFPFGTGWGTWGSYYAAKYYSPIFYLYELSNHHELGVLNQKYIMDTYLAVLFGEAGFLGSVAIFALVFLLFQRSQEMRHINERLYAAGLLSVAYLLITFLEETGFMNPALFVIAIEMGVVYSKYETLHNVRKVT